MKLFNGKRCVIGEGPIWNSHERKLYYVNGFENEIIRADAENGDYQVFNLKKAAAALGFDKNNRMIVTRHDGVFFTDDKQNFVPLYDTEKYEILYGNDSKVGPDGRYYVGTQSGKRFGVSDKIDGKLYSIDKNGVVKVLLDGIILSNGLEWSIDEKYLYHTDSDTNIIKEYEFDKERGEIEFTGRQIEIIGVDGFTIDCENCLWVTSSMGKVFRINTLDFTCVDELDVPAKYSASCGFAGDDMKSLVVVTSRYNIDVAKHPGAGLTYVKKLDVGGREPYLFG